MQSNLSIIQVYVIKTPLLALLLISLPYGAPVPSIQSTSELNQNIFRTILTFSTDSEPFQNSFCNDSETCLNQSKIQNLGPLNSSESEENSERNSELALNQNENQKVLPALRTNEKKTFHRLINCYLNAFFAIVRF